MSRLRKKSWLADWLESPIVLAVLLLCIVFLGISVFERFTVEREMAARQEQAAATLAELAARRAELEARVDDLAGDRGVETELRRNFDVARPGEQVVIILEDEPEPTTETVPPPPLSPAPWYQFWE